MKSLLLILVAALVLGAPPADADIRLEVERLVTAHNIGNADIAMVGCSTASGGFAIDGLDLAGEWLELDLLLIEPTCLYTAVRSAGLLGIVRNFTVEFFPLLPATTAGTDSLVTLPGTGIGWKPTFDWVQSTSARCFDAGEYTVRITRMDNRTERLDSRLDCIELSTNPIAVRPTSWGRIKQLYTP